MSADDPFEEALVDAYRSAVVQPGETSADKEPLTQVRSVLRAHRLPEEQGAYLLVMRRRQAAFWHALTRETAIGRYPRCELRLLHPWVSGIHCRITLEEPDWRVTDAGSKNGILVNGERTAQGFLREGDFIQIGDFGLIFLKVDRDGR